MGVHQAKGVGIMRIHHIRNATVVVNYAGKKFLVDPFLSEKGTLPPFSHSARQD